MQNDFLNDPIVREAASRSTDFNRICQQVEKNLRNAGRPAKLAETAVELLRTRPDLRTAIIVSPGQEAALLNVTQSLLAAHFIKKAAKEGALPDQSDTLILLREHMARAVKNENLEGVAALQNLAIVVEGMPLPLPTTYMQVGGETEQPLVQLVRAKHRASPHGLSPMKIVCGSALAGLALATILAPT